jgi:hypothetical protein
VRADDRCAVLRDLLRPSRPAVDREWFYDQYVRRMTIGLVLSGGAKGDFEVGAVAATASPNVLWASALQQIP